MLDDEDQEYSYMYCPTTKNGKGLNKRRFNDEQIKSLESMFESESRLEPRKKLKVASDLGLQPRQVAIWFQNKRARWKSKQLERDYNLLLSNFNTLTSRFESLKSENHGLVAQLQKLSNDLKVESRDGTGPEAKARLSEGISEHVEDDGVVKAEYLLQVDDDESDLLNMDNMAEPADSSLTWDHLNSETLFNESSTNSYDHHWWDFWS